MKPNDEQVVGQQCLRMPHRSLNHACQLSSHLLCSRQSRSVHLHHFPPHRCIHFLPRFLIKPLIKLLFAQPRIRHVVSIPPLGKILLDLFKGLSNLDKRIRRSCLLVSRRVGVIPQSQLQKFPFDRVCRRIARNAQDVKGIVLANGQARRSIGALSSLVSLLVVLLPAVVKRRHVANHVSVLGRCVCSWQ